MSEKVLSHELTPIFEYAFSNIELDSRAELYPHTMRLLSLFNDTPTSNIFLIRTDDNVDCSHAINDMCTALPAGKAKTLCYVLNKENEISVFEVWQSHVEDLSKQVSSVITNGDIASPLPDYYFVDEIESIRFIQQLHERKNDIASQCFWIDPATETTTQAHFAQGMFNEESLFGYITAKFEHNSYLSDIRNLHTGDIHKAHGQYLVVKIAQLLEAPALWRKLKTACVANENQLKSQYPSAISTVSHKTDFKLILVGDSQQISALSSFDPELSNNIDTIAEMRSEFYAAKQPVNLYTQFINKIIATNSLLPLSECGIKKLLTLSSRWCEHKSYLSLDEQRLTQTLTFSAALARQQNTTEITAALLEEALHLQHKAVSSHVETSNEDITAKQIVFTTTGKAVGQINGLSVLELPAHPEGFGEPIRITATAHLLGDGEISDVERKADLAGNIHAKSMMIIQGYLTHVFADPHPLPLHANIVFEQSYGEIDGDSASLAVAVAVLSALSKMAIRQDIAVTGAIDQFGNILAVGGINEKIEAFYRVCQLQNQANGAVLIPRANCINLNLSKEVQDAIANKQFTVYTAEHIEEALQLLVGQSAMPLDSEGSIFGNIQYQVNQLEEHDDDENLFAKMSSKFVNLFNITKKDN